MLKQRNSSVMPLVAFDVFYVMFAAPFVIKLILLLCSSAECIGSTK